MNTHDKYWWVYHHPAFTKGTFEGIESIEITPHMINPKTGLIEYKIVDHLNTKLQWWIEVLIVDWDIPQHGGINTVHDYELDCGADTIDEAIDKLYTLTKDKYGEYEE